MDVAAAEKKAVNRQHVEYVTAFKTNPSNTTIGGAKKRISTYFAPSYTASYSNQTKASGCVNITLQKVFALKLQPTDEQLLDHKISVLRAPKDVEKRSQNHALEMLLTGVNKSISRAATIFNYECGMRGVRGYHHSYLGDFVMNGKKPIPPEYNVAKIEHGILEAYKNSNSSSYFVLKSAFSKFYSISNDGIQKFAKDLNSVMISTLDENLNPLSANPTKWSTSLKQFVGCCWRIVWVCLTVLWVSV